MYKRGHIGIAILLYSPIVAAIGLYNASLVPFGWFGYLIVAFTATLPDIDLKIVKLQSRLPNFIKNNLPFKVKHRGFTHTIFYFALPLGVVSGALAWKFTAQATAVASQQSQAVAFIATKFPNPTLFGLFIGFTTTYGIIAHIVGDVITPTGVEPFRPISDVRLKYDFELFGRRTLAASDFWNTTFLTLGGLAVGLTIVTIAYANGNGMQFNNIADILMG